MGYLASMVMALAQWDRRRWLVAVLTAVGTALVIALPTAMIPNPVFGREIPVTGWAWPTLIVSSVLSGLLVATYVRSGTASEQGSASRLGGAGGLLTFFAVGCPVCNKLALLALGYSGAMQWFAPVQPYLALLGLALLATAFVVRVRGEVACPVPTTQPKAKQTV